MPLPPTRVTKTGDRSAPLVSPVSTPASLTVSVTGCHRVIMACQPPQVLHLAPFLLPTQTRTRVTSVTRVTHSRHSLCVSAGDTESSWRGLARRPRIFTSPSPATVGPDSSHSSCKSSNKTSDILHSLIVFGASAASHAYEPCQPQLGLTAPTQAANQTIYSQAICCGLLTYLVHQQLIQHRPCQLRWGSSYSSCSMSTVSKSGCLAHTSS